MSTTSEHSRGSVLVVDDEPTIGDVVSRYLQRAGYAVEVFDPEPPHELIATRDLSFGELRRLEEFGRAAAAVYRARVRP